MSNRGLLQHRRQGLVARLLASMLQAGWLESRLEASMLVASTLQA